MAIDIFTNLGNFISTITGAGLSSQTSTLISFITSIFSVVIILYVVIQGYLVLAGKSQEPILDVTFKLASLTIIFAFATNAGGWLNSVTGAIEGLRELGTNSSNPYMALDNLLLTKVLVINSIWSNAKTIGAMLWGAIAIIACIIGLLFFLVPLAIALVMNDIVLKILITFAPIFIFCLSFQVIRGMFNNWLQLCISNVLMFVFLSLIINIFLKIDGLVDPFNKGNEIYYSITVIIIGLFAGKLVAMAKELSGSLASVSAEGVGASMANSGGSKANQLADRGARAAGSATMKAAGSVGRATYNAISRSNKPASSNYQIPSVSGSSGSTITSSKVFKNSPQAIAINKYFKR